MKMKRGRFHQYNPFEDSADPESVGLVAHSDDYELGTPNLERGENILLVAANSALKHCLELRLKWRPNGDGKTVTTISKLSLIIGEDIYKFQQVERYAPTRDSFMSPNHIMNYGSSGSKLKLVVISPYRRMRLLFNGHVQRSSGQATRPQLIHLKLNCIILPVSEIFDFHNGNQIDEAYLRQLHKHSELVVHDRHEQRVKLNGEYSLNEGKGVNLAGRRHETIEIRGFYCRHFLTDNQSEQVTTRRLYAYANNGQGFQVLSRRTNGKKIDFGYTVFSPRPWCKFIEKPLELDSEKVFEIETQQFKLRVSGQKCTFECWAERTLENWFKLEFNGKPAWAWQSPDDELSESELELEAIEQYKLKQELLLQSGQICRPPSSEFKNHQTTTGPLVVSIEDELCSLSELVGAKATSLAQLHKFQESSTLFTVPKAVVLTKFAHNLILEENSNLSNAIEQLLRQTSAKDLGSFRHQCNSLQRAMSSCSLPESLLEELWQKLETNFGGDNGPEVTFAVRSSSWGEDEVETSAAGQLSTVLNVKWDRDELNRAVMSCFASKFSSENIEYKRQHGQPVDLPMAVVIQRMISCDTAGVMFTCDPTNGDQSLVTISANFGLGESVVSGQTDPDWVQVRVELQPSDYSLSNSNDRPESGDEKSLQIEQVKVGTKEIISMGDSKRDEPHDKSKCCLEDGQILQLAKCGLAVQQYFWSQRRDIEWGYKGNRLHLFQSRPVTGIEAYVQEELLHEFDRSPAGELNYYSRANVGEVLPFAAKPLTLNFCAFYTNLIIAQRTIMSLKARGETLFSPRVLSEFICEKYHFLFTCGQNFILALDEEKKSPLARSMEIALFGREIGPRPDIVESCRGFPKVERFFETNKFVWQTWRFRWMTTRTIQRELAAVLESRQKVHQLKTTTASQKAGNKLIELYNQLYNNMQRSLPPWDVHFVVSLLSGQSNMAITTILAKYIKDAKQVCAATNRFLAISPNVISGNIPKRIKAMAKLIRNLVPPETVQSFVQMQADNAFEEYFSRGKVKGTNLEPLAETFEEFLNEFGHRCYNEFELSSESWREQPQQVVEMIQQNCKADLQQDSQNEPLAAVDQTVDDVIKSLNLTTELSLKDKLLLKYSVAPRGQLLLSSRERSKNVLIMGVDVVRETCRLFAKELVLKQRLPDEQLFYYLAFDELKPLCLSHQPTIVIQATRRRQLFGKMFGELWKFDEIFSEVIPNHLKPTKELDETIAKAPKLFGTPASSGKVRGRICRVDGFKELDKARPNCILLTHSTDIAFSPVFPIISGIITEVGGLVSHGAVVAREYGLPCLIGIPNVTQILQDEEEIILDADQGTITRLSLDQD